MKTKIVETKRGYVEYFESGSGPPILYFHGTGVTADSMLPIESRLVDDGFRLIMPNRPGYGRTPLQPNTSAVDCADLAASLLDSLDIDAATVMGSSGGAAFAVSFAVRHAVRTKSLVLLCPQIHRWDHKRWLPAGSRWTFPLLRNRLLRAVLLRLYRAQLPWMKIQKFLKMEAGQRFAELVDDRDAERFCALSLYAMIHGTRCNGFLNDFEIFVHEDILDRTDVIHTPTLVLFDPLDPMAPAEHVNWFTSIASDCQQLPLHVAGHLVWVGQDAETMHQARAAFIRKHN